MSTWRTLPTLFWRATPETLVSLHGDRVRADCLAGSARRGKTEDGKIIGDYMMTGIRPKFAEALMAAGLDMDPRTFQRDEVHT